MVLKNISDRITTEYLFAVLKTDFFIEQILGFQNRGMYPRLDKSSANYIQIPIPKNKQIIEYISVLVRAFLNKQKHIRERHHLILKTIDRELKSNQKPNKFTYEFPSIDELQKVGRLDTGRYTEKFKKFTFVLNNYKNGAGNLTELGFKKPKRGQNLQISNIGKSFYSDKKNNSFYRLILSTNFSEYSTVEKLQYLGNPHRLTTLDAGDIVFSARGAQFGRCVIILEKEKDLITNIDSLVIKSIGNLTLSIFITMMLNFYRNNKHIYGIAITGSGANSLTQYQADDIYFPNFPEYKQEEIAIQYYNPNSKYNDIEINMNNFLEEDAKYNETAGLYNIKKTANEIKERINEVIDEIVNDKDVDISFDFI